MRIPKMCRNVCVKTIIFSLQVDFTDDFVPDCPFKLCFWQFKLWHRFSHWLYQIL